MRYLILSDLHANWEALAAVLRDAEGRSYEAVLVLGDLVGYGASPNQVIEAVRGLAAPLQAIRGNHDKVAAGLDDGGSFNATALAAARWTAGELSAANLRYLQELPAGPLEVTAGLTICHGSPRDEDAYLLSTGEAWEAFEAHPAALTFFGHTHVPSAFILRDEGIDLEVLQGDEAVLDVEPGARYLVNPGSVGQPRDRDPRAAYMLYDDERRQAVLRRVEYPVDEAQERIVDAGLPMILAERLPLGF